MYLFKPLFTEKYGMEINNSQNVLIINLKMLTRLVYQVQVFLTKIK